MIARIAACVALTLLVAAPLRLEAHHSAVMFDDQKEVTVEGTVKEFQTPTRTRGCSWTSPTKTDR